MKIIAAKKVGRKKLTKRPVYAYTLNKDGKLTYKGKLSQGGKAPVKKAKRRPA